jgi:capsular exopolysaccharide synthesis family protein
MADSDKYHNGRNGFIPWNGSQQSGQNSGQGQTTSGKDEKEIDLKKFFYLLYNKKWVILGTVVIFGIIAGVIAFLTTPTYQSSGSIMISNGTGKSNTILSADNGFSNILSSAFGLGMGSTLNNQMQILKSRKLSRAIADSVLEKRTMKNGEQFPLLYTSYPDDPAFASRNKVAKRIRENIVFERVDPHADLIKISYLSPSPLEAAFLVNACMQVYTNITKSNNRSSASSAMAFLTRERKRVHTKLDSSENNLRKFMNRSDLVQVDGQTQQLIKQMANLETNLHTAKTKLVAINSGVKKYKNELDNIKPGLADQFSKAVGPHIIRLQHALAELQLHKAQLTINYPNGKAKSTPELKKTNRKIQSYKSKIKKLTQESLGKNDQYLSFIGGDANQVAGYVSKLTQKLIELNVQKTQYQAQVGVISRQLDTEKAFFKKLPDNIIQLARLKRNVAINSQLYKTISDQYAQTRLWEQTQFGRGHIIDQGIVPKHPVKPRSLLYILVGFVLGGIASVGFVIVRDAFNTKVNSVEMIRGKPLPLLSVIPQFNDYIKKNYKGKEATEIQGKKISTGLVTLFDAMSPLSESFRRLQNNLIYTNPDEKLKSLMITSPGKGDGKTTTISNLGVIMAEAGYQTLIVDTDLRRPNVHKMFGLKRTPGLMEILFDNVSREDAVQKTIVPGLGILSAGMEPPNPTSIMQSRSFLDCIKKMENHYDFVLIDTPPFGIITDSAALITQTDEIAIIVRYNETLEAQLDQTLEQLNRINAKVLGTVLTAFNYKNNNDHYYNKNYYKEAYQDYSAYRKS